VIETLLAKRAEPLEGKAGDDDEWLADNTEYADSVNWPTRCSTRRRHFVTRDCHRRFDSTPPRGSRWYQKPTVEGGQLGRHTTGRLTTSRNRCDNHDEEKRRQRGSRTHGGGSHTESDAVRAIAVAAAVPGAANTSSTTTNRRANTDSNDPDIRRDGRGDRRPEVERGRDRSMSRRTSPRRPTTVTNSTHAISSRTATRSTSSRSSDRGRSATS